MLKTNVTNLRKNLFSLLEQTIKFNEPIHVSTKDGNAVILSEEDYNGLIETLLLSSSPEMKKKSSRACARRFRTVCRRARLSGSV